MLGPIICDVEGLELTAHDIQSLQSPWVGGVILFQKNFSNPTQLKSLITAIKQVRNPPLLIAVDQEGGRVQRLKEGFTRLPCMRRFGEMYDKDPLLAETVAYDCGYVNATELLAIGIDLNFAPVLDLDRGQSAVIGDRAGFHATTEGVTTLARAFILGMQAAGMQAVGKHFPGHGAVTADSHLELPTDNRPKIDIFNEDLKPFEILIPYLKGMMTAHIIYPQISNDIVTFSSYWLKSVLQKQCQFKGIVISDDLMMKGAANHLPDLTARVMLALESGCHSVLVCHAKDEKVSLLQTLATRDVSPFLSPLSSLYGDYNQDPLLYKEALERLKQHTPATCSV